jgi:parallel beta helix pectate lyase-like protein
MRRRAGFLILALCLSACSGGPKTAVVTPTEVGPAADVAGPITTSTTWRASVHLAGDATIKPGVTVDIAAGTRLSAAREATLIVEGTLNVNGTASQNVVFVPDGAGGWGGIRVAPGGRGTVRYADATARTQSAGIFFACQAGASACLLESAHVHEWGMVVQFEAAGAIRKSRLEGMANGGIFVGTGADLTISDSVIRTSDTDLIVLAGGRLHIEYSQLGDTGCVAGPTPCEPPRSYEHCGLHTTSSAALRIDHTVFKEAVYGMMLGYTTGAQINHNNFLGNGVDIENIGGLSDIDITQNYFDGRRANIADGAQPFRQDATPLPSPFADAGPRP